MMPHLVRWQETYGAQGFTAVYADDGRRDSRDSALSWSTQQRIPFPVFHDSNGGSMQAYGIQAYPTAYILDRSGRVVWEGIPIYNPAAVERAIQAALR